MSDIMLQPIANFFNSENFMPHGHCFLWQPEILWLHVVSDAAIVAAYFSIPFALLYFIWKRKDMPFQSVFLLFGAFILLCGTTHIMGIWVLWHPDYAVEGILKALTAIASITTFFAIVRLIPQALALPSPAQLAAVNQELRDANHKLALLYEQSQESTQSHLRTVVDNILDGLITIDERGHIESFNPACERIFGYTGAEVIGQNIKMLMPEPYHGGHDGYLHHYVTTGEAKIIGTAGREVQAKRKDGSIFPMDLAVSAFQLAGIRHFSGIIRDITTRKQFEERNALLAAVVASSDDAIISKTLEGMITSWNESAERLFGYSAGEAMGQNINLIIPPEKMEEAQHIIEQLSQGTQIQHFETERLNKNREYIPIALTISPIRNTMGDIIGASKILRDITEQKKTEAKLLLYTNALERSNQELDDFAYIASHDLKEPLRGLFNNAKFLEEDYSDKLDAKGIGRLQRLGYLCQRMEQLINDLMYFSRLGRQELAIVPTELNGVIDDIASMMEITLKEQNAIITVPRLLPEIICDKTRVTEIFRNLITNAVKYNDREKKMIEVGYIDEMITRSGVEKRVFYVRDNGIGIEEEFYEDIFRIFKRLNEEDDNKKGTGVGLTFVRKIVDRHGGRIWLESKPGEGTTFYFTIIQGVAYAAAA